MVGFVYRICRLLVGCCDIERISAIESGGSKENKKKTKRQSLLPIQLFSTVHRPKFTVFTHQIRRNADIKH